MKTSVNVFKVGSPLLIIAATFMLHGCYFENICINGKGIPRIEMRTLQSFTGIVSNGSFEVYVHPS